MSNSKNTVPVYMLKDYNKVLKNLKLINIVIDPNFNLSYHEQVYLNMRNENLYMLVIENMSLGIIMTKQIAFQFDYIKNIVNEYESFKTLLNYNIKIVMIDKNWDTERWCQKKMLRFYTGMNACDGKTIEQIKKDPYINRMNEVDSNFLEALSWKSPYIDDTYYLQEDSSGNYIHTRVNYGNNEPEPMPYFNNH